MYGEKLLFKDISIHIDKGQKIAMVAENGTGKTTLLRVIAGEESPEGENRKILMRKDIRTGYLKQDPEFQPGHNIMDAVFEIDHPMINAVKEYEQAVADPADQKRLEKASAIR